MSTTHTTVGAIVGMSLVLQGAGAVAWNERTNEFPFFTGISAVVASWCGARGCTACSREHPHAAKAPVHVYVGVALQSPYAARACLWCAATWLLAAGLQLWGCRACAGHSLPLLHGPGTGAGQEIFLC